MHFNSILPSIPTYLKWPLPLDLQIKIVPEFCFVPMRAICPIYLIPIIELLHNIW